MPWIVLFRLLVICVILNEVLLCLSWFKVKFLLQIFIKLVPVVLCCCFFCSISTHVCMVESKVKSIFFEKADSAHQLAKFSQIVP